MPIAFSRFDCAGPVWRSVRSSTSRRVRKRSGMALELGDSLFELLDHVGRFPALGLHHHDLRHLIHDARVVVALKGGDVHAEILAQALEQARAHAVTSI